MSSVSSPKEFLNKANSPQNKYFKSVKNEAFQFNNGSCLLNSMGSQFNNNINNN